ncbi:MAG: PilT protein domain protein [Deltaproteobacteria bacterium]|jgi:predicted nucleic acid-binding protein|nr:PilT protein domain protein [Deltaproteobacteria bacterium]
MNVFADTSAFYALLDASDGHHRKAAGAWQEIIDSDQDVVTSNYVLVETFALIQSRLGLDAVRGFQEDIVPVLSVKFITPELHRLGIAALLAASRRGLSLVDCVSFEMMRELGIKSAFAFDPHYREYGFTPIP